MMIVISVDTLEVGPLRIHRLSHVLTRAIGSNMEVILNCLANDGPLGGTQRSLMATEVVVLEELDFFFVLASSENGVGEEYR